MQRDGAARAAAQRAVARAAIAIGAAVLTLAALLLSVMSAKAQEVALLRAPSPPSIHPAVRARPPRRGSSGAESDLARMLRHRIESEEEAARLDTDGHLLELASWLNTPLRFQPSSREADDLRALVAPDVGNVVVQFEGFDRIAVHEIRRQYRRLFRSTHNDIYGQRGPDRRWFDESDDAYYEGLGRSDVHRARFADRFPLYWTGHPSARSEAEVVTYGEEIRLLRLADYELTNDLRVRRVNDAEAAAAVRGRRSPEVDAADRHPPGVRRRTYQPNGLIDGDWFAIEARGRLRVAGMRPVLWCRLELEVFDDCFDRPFAILQLEGEAAPFGGSGFELALMVELDFYDR